MVGRHKMTRKNDGFPPRQKACRSYTYFMGMEQNERKVTKSSTLMCMSSKGDRTTRENEGKRNTKTTEGNKNNTRRLSRGGGRAWPIQKSCSCLYVFTPFFSCCGQRTKTLKLETIVAVTPTCSQQQPVSASISSHTLTFRYFEV